MANGNNISPQQQNLMARANLLRTGVSMVKRLQSISATENTTVKVPLLRMGIMTGVLLQFTVDVDVSDAGTATLSEVAPWNLLRRVSYNDFAGVKRTNTNGFQLYIAQSFKAGDALSSISPQPRIDGAFSTNNAFDFYTYTNNVLNVTGDVSASGAITDGSAQITFSVYVPMAYDPTSDLTGAVLTQTNVGEHYIEIDLAPLMGTDPWTNPLINGGSAVITDHLITIEAFQQYIQPQSMSADSLPVIDLSTIYGFEGAYETSANIANGMSTYINYPNNRSVLSALVNFQDNNTFNNIGSDLDGIVLLANSNTNFKEMSPRYVKESMRNIGNMDAPGGSYFFSSRRQPILTQLYANVQLRFDVATLGGSGLTKFISQYEVQYASGAPLPGITIAA